MSEVLSKEDQEMQDAIHAFCRECPVEHYIYPEKDLSGVIEHCEAESCPLWNFRPRIGTPPETPSEPRGRSLD